MTTGKLLEIAARLFTQHGSMAEVYVPIMVTAEHVIERADDVRPDCHELAKVYINVALRNLSLDEQPDELFGARDRAIDQAQQSIPREWRR